MMQCTCTLRQRQQRKPRKDCQWHRIFPFVDRDRDAPLRPTTKEEPVLDRDVWQVLNRLHESVLRMEKTIERIEARQTAMIPVRVDLGDVHG